MAGYLRTKTRVGSGASAHALAGEGEVSVVIGQEGVKVPAGDAQLTVGEVAKLTGVKTSALRHYDKIGLLCPARTGKGIANNRKLYSAGDLERLQAICTLSAYGFGLDEISGILEDNSQLYEVLSERLVVLRLQEAHIRNLVLFAHYIELFDTELLEGLACGPAELDLLAVLARRFPHYSQALQKLLDLDEKAAEEALEQLDPVLVKLLLMDSSEGFSEIERTVENFFSWWDTHVVSLDEVGFLGFWAVFEDHSLVAEHIETVGQAGDAGFLEMDAFFVVMKRLLTGQSDTMREVANLAETDVVAALECAANLVDAVAREMLGATARECAPEELASLALCVLQFAARILLDEELVQHLELDGLGLEAAEVAKVERVLEVMCGDD